MGALSRRTFIAGAVVAAASLAACDADVPADDSDDTTDVVVTDPAVTGPKRSAEPPVIEILESGMSDPSYGYVSAWAVARNTSETDAVVAPQIRLAACDEAGNELQDDVQPVSDEIVLAAMPGQTFAVATFFEAAEGISRVEAQALAVEDEAHFTWEGDVPQLPVTDVSVSESGTPELTVTGMVENDLPDEAYVRVVAILRDAEGRGMDANFDFGSPIPAGEKGSFSIGLVFPEPHASVDLYALAEYREE